MNRFEKKLKKGLETNGAPTQDGYDELCHRLGITSDYVIGSADSLAKPKKDGFFHFRKNIFVLAATLTLAFAIGASAVITDQLNSDSFYDITTFHLDKNEEKFLMQYTASYKSTPFIVSDSFFNINILRGIKKESYSTGYFFFIRSQKAIDAKIDFTSNDFQTTFLTKERTYGYINPDDDLQDEITMKITFYNELYFMTFSI